MKIYLPLSLSAAVREEVERSLPVYKIFQVPGKIQEIVLIIDKTRLILNIKGNRVHDFTKYKHTNLCLDIVLLIGKTKV